MMRVIVNRLVSNTLNGTSTGIGFSPASSCLKCTRSYTGLSSQTSNFPAIATGRVNDEKPILSSCLSVMSPPNPVFMIARGIKTTAPTKRINFFTPRDDTTLWGRTLKKLGFTEIPKSVLRQSGYLIYMKMVDSLDYMAFFKICNLPDTYNSWFVVIELHVWLVASRLMQDGKEGRIVRNSLIKAMWEDNSEKSKKLEGALPSARRRELQVLNEQFHATMIGYDEGLLGDDYILAGALWRRIMRLQNDPTSLLPQHFDSKENHDEIGDKVKAIEMLVIYVRSQFVMLNQLSREQLLRKRAFQFVPFDDSLFDLVAKMEKSQISGGGRGRVTSAQKSEAVKMR